MHTPPLVSVVIPAFNSAKFIGATLSSALAQSTTDFDVEVIVVNDGSTDTPELERELIPYLSRITYATQANAGPSAARNLAIRQARGTYVAFLDSDDQWLPDFLQQQMRVMSANPSLDLLYSNGVCFGDSPLAGRALMDLSPSSGAATFERLITAHCTVLTTCTVARRQAIVDAGLFDEGRRRAEDFHLWLRMAFRGSRVGYQRSILARYRCRAGSLASDRPAMMHALIDVLEDLDDRLPLKPPQRALIRRQISLTHAELAFDEAKRHFLSGRYEPARAALERASRFEPRPWLQPRLRAIHAAMCLAPGSLRRTYEWLQTARA